MYINRIICGCSRAIVTTNITNNLGNIVRNQTVLFARHKEVMLPVSRNIFATSNRYTAKNVMKYPIFEQKLRKVDKIPEGFELIYKTPKYNYITMCSTMTIVSFTIIGGLGLFEYLFGNPKTEYEPVYITENQVFAASWYDYYKCTVVLFIMTLGILTIANRYVQRIYRKGDDYVAIYAYFLPRLGNRISFQVGEVKYIPVKYGILPWSNALFKIKNKKSIMMEDRFKTYHDFRTILGGKMPGSYYDDIDEDD